jgi:hypothetical protein
MFKLLDLLRDTLTLSLVGLVLFVGLVALVMMWIGTRHACDQLNGISYDMLKAASSMTRPARVLARLRREQNETDASGRIVLAEAPHSVLRSWVDDEVLTKGRFEAGSWLTGLALMCTFFLIALVLARDIGPAISGGTEDGMVLLAAGVSTMGAKFVVSIAGIFMSVLHGVLRSHWVTVLYDAAAVAAARLDQGVVTADDLRLEAVLETAERNAAICHSLEVQNQMLSGGFGSLESAIAGLRSIEVSVQDIGVELKSTLTQVVRRDIVEKIQRDMQEIADGFAQALGASIASQVADITAALKQIEAAVAGQAQGQVEELLSKLSDLVSGGFSTESSRMKETLARFAEVVPQLEAQMRTMASTVGRDIAQRSEANARMNEAMFQKLETVLSGLVTQQQGGLDAARRLEEFVLQTQTTMASALVNADRQMTERSQISLGELQGAMRSATDDAAEVYGRLVREIEGAASLLKESRADTSRGASDLRESAQTMRAALSQMQQTVGSLGHLGADLNQAVVQAQSTIQQGALALQSSSKAIAEQQQFVSALSARWPQMAEHYIATSDDAFKKVAEAWKAQAGAIEESVGTIGRKFQDSVQELAIAVQSLEEQLAQATADRPAKGEDPARRAQ